MYNVWDGVVLFFFMFIKYLKLKNMVEVRIYFLFIFLYFDFFIRFLLIKYLYFHTNK